VNLTLNGAITALLTPCRADGSVDLDALPALIDHQVEAGIVGLFVLGTAGQGPMLDTSERRQLLREIIAAVDGRLAVIAHVGAMPTTLAVDLAEDAAAAGATALSSVPPVYYRPDSVAVESYYRALADAVPGLPLLAYNNLAATGYDLRPAEAARLHDAGVIAGVKQASDSVSDLHALLAAGVPVWMASATLNTAALTMGACGTISTITNVVPELFVALYHAVQAGDLVKARELQHSIDGVAARLRKPIIGALHAGATVRGLPAGCPRQPLRMPDDAETQAIQAAVLDAVR
jgi:dihydrodipicolinate synthase/N-acetylneuraminate lyase